MTLLAGGASSVNSEELLESIGVRDAHSRVYEEVGHGHFAPSWGGSQVRGKSAGSRTRRPHVAPSVVVREGAAYRITKRALDITGSFLALLFLSPLIASVALLTKLSDGGTVFYPHTRIGKWGREFKCMKFRTMVMNADSIKADIAHLNTHDDHRTFKVPDDPRVTSIGRWLRRLSIDEVPQLWNVVKGDMSLVGPRPPVPQEVERYDLDDMQRLMVKPGLTCIWQVSGRSRLPFPEQLAMDMAYIETRGIWLDLKLIALTVPAVLSADGAY